MSQGLPREGWEAEKRQRLWVGGGVAVLAVALTGLLYSDRERVIHAQGNRLEKTAEIVSKNVERQLAVTKVALFDVRRDADSFTDGRRAIVTSHLQTLGRVMPEVSWFAVCAPDGRVMTTSAGDLDGASFARESFFTQIKQSKAKPDEIIISSPFRMANGTVTLTVALRQLDAQGNLAFVVVAGLNAEYFQLFLETVSFAPDVRAAVVHEDGRPFVQGPPGPNMVVEESLDREGALFRVHRRSGRSRSIIEGQSAFMSDHLLTAWVNIDPPGAIDDLPLVAIVYRSWDPILAAWRHQAESVGVLFALMATVLATGLWSFQSASRRHAQLQQRTLESEQETMRSLGLALQAGNIGTFEWELDTAGAGAGDGAAVASDVAKTILGLHLDGAMLQEVRRFIHLDDIDRIRETVAKSAAAGGVITAEWRWFRPDNGQMIWIMMKGRVAESGDSARRRLLGVIVDISDRVFARELQDRADRALASSQASSAFMSHVSHELRTPMNAVLGFAQILSADREGTLSTDQKRQLSHLRQAGRHMTALIDDLLDLSMIEAGRLSVSIETVDACAAANDVRTVLQPLADDAKVTLDIPQPSLNGKWVRADMVRLKQVLMNLVSNAVKYNRPGGSVTLTMVPLEGTQPPMARVDVTDTGIGMTPEQMEHLFEPFNRLGAQPTAVRGTGIGLSITRSLVAAMGGEMSVTTRPGDGSTFSFTLETVSIEDARIAGLDHEARGFGDTASMPLDLQGPHRPISVLYVEDNPVNVIIVEQIAAQREYITFAAAESGAEAMRMVEETHPDLLLLDMHLGDTDGLALLAALREGGWLHGTRCVMLSADAGKASKAAALNAGFDAYITKPVDVREVLAEFDLAASQPAPV